jgi:hypothetical protein
LLLLHCASLHLQQQQQQKLLGLALLALLLC